MWANNSLQATRDGRSSSAISGGRHQPRVPELWTLNHKRAHDIVRFNHGNHWNDGFSDFLLFFTCVILAAGCSRAHVFVSNQSGTTLSNLVIFGFV